MNIFEQEYNAGLQKTAADQFEEIIAKMASEKICEKCGKPLVKEGAITKCGCGVTKTGAALDGSDVLNKVNPVDTTFGAPTDARSLEEGLRRVEAAREGRGKITELAARKAAARQHEVQRANTPLASGLSGFMEDPEDVKRMKMAAARNPIVEQDHNAALLALREKIAAKTMVVTVPERSLSKKEKAGLITAGSVLGAGGLALGGYGVHKAHQARDLGERAVRQATAAGQNVAEQAKVIGDKVSQAATDLSETSKQVSKAVEPAVELAEKGKATKKRAQQGADRAKKAVTDVVEKVRSPENRAVKAVTDIIERGRSAKKRGVAAAKVVGEHVPDVIRSAGGRVFRRITKRGADDTATALMIKAASEGRVRTLEGWNKTAADTEKDRYVRRVGREAAGMGTTAGIMSGGLAGAGAGAAIGARRGHPVKGAIIGALGGAAAGGVGGGLGLKAVAERNAAKQSPSQRKAATRFNVAHARYQSGELSRKQYVKEMGQFLKSRGLGHVAPKG